MQNLLTFFSKNISIYAIFNDQSFNETLTNDIRSFEQLCPDVLINSGDVRLCPHVLHQYTIEDQGALGQFGDSCYEIVPILTTWLKGKEPQCEKTYF